MLYHSKFIQKRKNAQWLHRSNNVPRKHLHGFDCHSNRCSGQSFTLIATMSSPTISHQENIRIFGYRIPHYFWFMMSGALCDIIQAFVDFFIYNMLPDTAPHRATICWTVSYTISIFIRHYSHRIIVFGEYEGSYCSSLARTYLTYSSSIVISMVCNHLLVNYAGLQHREAWIVTMLWTGIYNYFMLKASWNSKSKTEPKTEVEMSLKGNMV